jgi:flagellar biosynthetic protein FliR
MGLGVGEWSWGCVVGHAGVWALVLARILGLCVTAPALAVPELDWRFRVGLAVMLGLVLFPVLEPVIEPPLGWPHTAWAAFLELLTGGAMGWAAALVVAGARMAGELVAAGAGLSMVTVLEPDSGEGLGPIGRLYGWIALVMFLALHGPLMLVRALVESYHVVPAGRLLVAQATVMLAFAQMGRALALALEVAAAPAIALVMAGIVLGWLSRAAPSLPFLALAMPIRSFLGIALVALGVTALALTLGGAWDSLRLGF